MNMPTIKAVLFDLDDTLWPVVPVIMHAETVLYDWLAINIPGVTREFTNDRLREIRTSLMEAHPHYQIDLWALRHATLTEACHLTGEDKTKVDHAMAVFADARNAVTLFEDVVPALTLLGERFTLGSISNGFADLEAIGLAPHFHASIAAHRFGLAKPDAAIFHAACDALNVAPNEAVYVGDDPTLDVEGAQKAGLRAVWINRFDRTVPAHIAPDASFTTLDGLDRWLTRCIMENNTS
jgi:HAD superfamily hydrolase (TIGR01549 family)